MKSHNKSYPVLLIIIMLAGYGFGQVASVGTPVNASNTNPPANLVTAPPNPIEDLRKELRSIGNYRLSQKDRRKIAQQQELEILNGDNRLNIPSDYEKKFAALLKDGKVNLARIHPNKNCFSGKVVDVVKMEACADGIPMFGDGSYYSFRYRTHTNLPTNGDYWTFAHQHADIQFDNGKFLTGGRVMIQGLISELSNVDLESLTSKSAVVKSLREYKPNEKIAELEGQQAELKKGISLGNQIYKDSAPVKIGAIYLVRSIPYNYFHPMALATAPTHPVLHSWYMTRPNGSHLITNDITVAFKVVGQENDGSLIILWKELKQKDSPILNIEGKGTFLTR